MEIKFIGQGLDPASNLTTGNIIIDSLSDLQFNRFNAFVAFVSIAGLKNISDQLVAFKAREGEIKLYVGVDLNGTSKEALNKLLELEIETYVIFSPNNIIYHPKIFAFKGQTNSRAVVGSTNLTERGLFQSVEASVRIDFQNDDEVGNTFLSEIYDYFNRFVSNQHPSCKRLTPALLEILLQNKIVLPDAVNRQKTNKVNKEFGRKERKVNKQLLDIFGKLEIKRPPKGFRKTVVKKEMIPSESAAGEQVEIAIVDEAIELTPGSMWIETRKMTGGSRNILDLSKRGRLNGVEKFGSVSYFGVDPNNEGATKNINIIFGDKHYLGNLIFYAPDNSNWRIRLNGETQGGEGLTTFSIPTLGQNGGFQFKILLFTKVDDFNFRLEILERDNLSQLIENSSDWAKGGSGVGRAYGIISA
jgi:HKD family nuclease